MTMYVSIRRKIIADNKKMGRNDPPYEIRTSKTDPSPQTVHSASYNGTVKLVYDPSNPLISGAVAWLEIEPAAAD